jgi:Fe-S cluster assembly ATPase SufC
VTYRRSELLDLRPAERGKAGVALSLWTPRTDME